MRHLIFDAADPGSMGSLVSAVCSIYEELDSLSKRALACIQYGDLYHPEHLVHTVLLPKWRPHA